MSIYRRKDRLIHFIHIPKCGGASIRRLLGDNDWVDVTPDIPKDLRSEIRNKSRGRHSSHIHRKIWKEWQQSYEFQFALIRNPYDRLISHLKQVTNNLNITKIEMMYHVQQFFDEIKNSHSVTTSDGDTTGGVGFADNHWRPQVDFIGKETCVYSIESDIEDLLCELMNRDIISKKSNMPHERKGKWEFDNEIPWRNFLRTHDNFVNFYHLDFEVLGYNITHFKQINHNKV